MSKHLLLTFLLLALPLLGQQTPPQKAQHPRKDTATIAKEAKGAVVSIVMADKGGHPIAQGSGFLVSRDGWVVTNYHVIKSGNSAVIKVPDGDFFIVDGVLAFDKDRDVAVIKAHGNNFQTVVLGDSDRLEVGEEVVAIGSPLSLESTVSNGIVSGIRTDKGRTFLQITAPISHGSSGGALFNLAGEVVGITSAGIQSGENLNFAVPINDARRLLQLPAHPLLAFPDKREAAAISKNQVTAPAKNWKTDLPDLQQTTDWLHDFVEANGFIDFDLVHPDKDKTTLNSYLTFNGCHGIIKMIFKSESNPSNDEERTIGFNLGDIDPDTVDSLCSGDLTCSIDFKTTNFKKLITETGINSEFYPDGVPVQGDWSGLLTLWGKTSGPRFVTALKHAVVICGGKASTF